MSLSFNKNNDSSLLSIVNYLILMVYMGIVLISLRRFTGLPEYGYVFLIRFLLYVFLFILCMIKICYKINTHYGYSIFSIVLLAYSGYVLFSKLDFNILNYILYGENLFAFIMMIIATKDIPYDKIIKAFFIPAFSFMLLRLLGTATSWLYWSYYELASGEFVLSFDGRSHNLFPRICALISMAWIYLNRKRKSICIDITIIAIFNSILYYFSKSRTSVIIAIGMCAVSMCIWFYNNFVHSDIISYYLKKLFILLTLAPIALFIITFALLTYLNYYTSFIDDRYLSSTFFARIIYLSQDCSANNIWTPFHTFPLDTNTSFNWFLGGVFVAPYEDNVLHLFLIRYGIIFLALLFALLQCSAIKAYKSQNLILCIIICLVSMLGIMENSIIDLATCPFLILPFSKLDYETIPCFTLTEQIKISWLHIRERICNQSKTSKAITLSVLVLYSIFTYIMLMDIATNHITAITYAWLAITSYVIYSEVNQ